MHKSMYLQNQPTQVKHAVLPRSAPCKSLKMSENMSGESHWQLQGAVPYRIQIVLEIFHHGLKHAEEKP